ncbi:hypothetical protein X943_002601 [Babesia divergens]|uniref:Uncharacterized protein n=1 Tax=Babesia divergens TaxID=32595 RepID=A0AAD9GHK5_BABDI|nr:hypothetical protein X943_002601 [Babesia divergens]
MFPQKQHYRMETPDLILNLVLSRMIISAYTYMDYADVPSGNPMSCKSAPLKPSYITVIAMEGTLDGALEVYEDLHDSKEPSSFLELNVQKKPESGSRHMERDALSGEEDKGTGSASSISMIPGPAKRQGDTLSFSTKKPFKPKQRYTFRNVALDVADTHLDLRDSNGVIVGRFTMTEQDSYTLALLSTLNERDYTKCDVKWVPESKTAETSGGHIQFDCKAKVPAKGYTGEVPIAIEVTGLSKSKAQRIYLNTDGFNFRRDFQDLDDVKHAILLALGIDLDHQIKITKVNDSKQKDAASVYKAITKLVDSGSKVIKLTVEPMIRLATNLQEPYSASSDLYSHDTGNISVNDYIKLLKDRKKLVNFAKRNLGEDADGFTLVGINDLHEGSKGFDNKSPYKMPIEIDERWTFMPDVTVRFHYLDSYITSKSFPVHTSLSEVVSVGKRIMKKNRGGKNSKAYRVYAYSLPGCPLEEPDIYDMIKRRKDLTISQLPFNEACVNRRTHVIDFFYLNSKPAKYVFDVELMNPDGTQTKPKRITVNYVDDTDIGVLKDVIVSEFEKEGHLITPDDLTFVNVISSDGHEVTNKTKILNLAEIAKDQMKEKVSNLMLKVSPHLMGYFTEPSGQHDTFEINLGTTKPSMDDIKHAFEDELHRRNLLKPNEGLHTTLRFHPVDSKNKIKMNKFLYPDDNGHFPAGSKLRGMAAEADSRYEIPIKFTNDDGKAHKFTVHVPYGASDQQIEDLIANEIEKRKYGSRPREMLIRIKGHEDDELGNIWQGNFDDSTELEVEPARLVDIDGIIDDIPTKFSLKIHPHEGREELERAVRRSIMREPGLVNRFKENPNHINDISTLIINENNIPYTDDDFSKKDIYSTHRVRIGVSDHSMTIVWKDPESGVEASFCFSRAHDGSCRGVPAQILSRMTIQQISDVLRNTIRRENRELYGHITAIPRKNKSITPNMKLREIVLVNGEHLMTYDIQLDDSILMLEHMYGIKLSHISSLVLTLMSREERQHLHDRLGNKKAYRLMLNKSSGIPESHVVIGNDYTPAELRNVINKYFRGVDDSSQLDHMTINGEDYKNQPLSYFFNKMEDKNSPLKVGFSVVNDVKPSKIPSVANVRIQPKYNETLRSYFERAMDEPRDFGLSPLHSYMVACINEKGERVHIANILDQPISALGMCKDIEVQMKKQGRTHDPNRLYVMDPQEKMELHTTITLDEKNDNTSNLNRQLRNFLMELPENSLDHVTVLVDDKPVKCSLSSLREAYLIRNLTLDTLLSLCNMDSHKTQPSVFKLNLNMDTLNEGGKGRASETTSARTESGPICYFTLHKGQHDVGVSSAVPITLGTLKSPLKELYSKLTAMFGQFLSQIGDVRLSVVRNGEFSVCSTAGKIKTLADFNKLPLQSIFQMCHIPVGIPEGDIFYHFRVNIPFGEDITYTSSVSMGGNVPVEMLYKDDDEFSATHYNEDLHHPIYDFLSHQPDVDMDHLDHYTLKIKGQNSSNEPLSRSFKLNHLPSEMSLASVFPHTPVNNIVFQVEDTNDPYNSSGGWRTGMSYPVNDYRNNFDAIKRQMIINLKGMHGNGLSKLNGYNVVVTINGQKHRCHIKSLPDLESMTFQEFNKSCVNIEHIQNNPSMSFNVSYESGRGEPEINVTCLCNDFDTLRALHLSPKDPVPQHIIDGLSKKYGGPGLKNVRWGVVINGMQGNCHINDIGVAMQLAEILETCGVDDTQSRRFDITFHDLSVDFSRVNAATSASRSNGKKGSNGVVQGKMTVAANGGDDYSPLLSFQSHSLHPSPDFADVHSNVFINMPQEYKGPSVNVEGHKSVNDYVREIIMDEDQSDPGAPINIRMNTNGHHYDLNTLPMDGFNYPSEYLNGNMSINVRKDPSGSLPGTIRTFHLPDNDQPLSSYFTALRSRVPDIGDKKIMLVGKNTMLEESRIPLHTLQKPMSQLKKDGFVISIVNDPQDIQPSGSVSVNVISKDGFTGTATITDLQEPLRDVFMKMGGGNVNLESLAGAKFKVIVDGIEKVCHLPGLDKLVTAVSMQDIMSSCGISDLNHSHIFTLYFDSLIGGESGAHRNPFKLEVDLNDKVESTKNIDYSSSVGISDSALDFLKSKPNSHIFFDMEGKSFREFIEVDTEKFRKLLKSHPNVVDLLLRMGIPQEHLGGIDCLKIILSTLSQVLQGHQQFSVNNSGESSNFNIDEPLSKYPSIADIAKVLQQHSEQDVTVTVQLASGNTKDFVVSNREFLHALNGGLSFKDVAVWGLSKDEADQIMSIHFNTAPYGGIPEDVSEPSFRDESVVKSTEGEHSDGVKKGTAQKHRSSTSKHNASQSSQRAGTITPDTMLSDVSVVSKAMNEHDRNVKFVVATTGGKTYEILVKGSMLKDQAKSNTKIIDLLSNFLPNEDRDNIASISVQLVSNTRKFFVPLSSHKSLVMPIMASDRPKSCKIQEFKNPWNPAETVYRHLTLGNALNEYKKHYKLPKDIQAKGAYLLRKEAGNNISAELLFDEQHPADKQTLDRNIGSDIDSGSTLFIRYLSSGELTI